MGRQAPLTVAWVGLGAIASHHVAALAELSALAEPVAGCDPSAAARVRFADRLTAYESLEEMLDAASVDVVVVSTPTPTHHEVCRRVLRHGGTRTVLVEKPIATTVEEVAELLDAAQAAGIDLRGLYHAAHGPEVDWALSVLAGTGAAVRSLESEFLDPYAGGEAAATFGDSWLDSGINALSIAARLVTLERGNVVRIPTVAHTFLGTFAARSAGEDVEVKIVTSWTATKPSKVTRVRLTGGGRLILNHQDVAAQYVPGGGDVVDWASASPLARLTQHYVGAFRDALSTPRSDERDLLLHALLLGSRA